jgi:hypothetical protein
VTALAQALLPLYRGYLRRLHEMADRIGEDKVLREPIARDESRSLVRHESGFVLRFDVADSQSGETFEVHGARADDPVQREVRVGAVRFLLEPGNWEELPLRCVFAGKPPEEDLAALADLLHGWAVLAANGGFATSGEDAVTGGGGWSGRLHSAAVRVEESEVVAALDLGTCPPGAFGPLAGALAAFGPERSPLERVVIGGPKREDS